MTTYRIEPPFPGRQYGCNDTAPPSQHTAQQLSRLADLLHAAHVLGGPALAQAVFNLVPEMRGEFNYSNWRYVP
jgi:hypothetical protein